MNKKPYKSGSIGQKLLCQGALPVKSLILTSWLLLLLISPVFAGNNGNARQQPGNNGNKEARFEAIANQLNLSDDQREKIKTLRQAQKQQMEALMQQMQAKRQQMKSELNNPSTTRESIAPIATEIKNIQSQLVDLRINNIFTIKEMLNEDQFSKLQQFHQQKTGDRKERRQNRLENKRGDRENKRERNRDE